MKNVFVVLSPPRSGSSCVARALQTLGVELGTDLMAPAPGNPKGFFEDEAMRSINTKLLEHVTRFQNGEHSLNIFESEVFSSACELLGSRFKSCNHYGFKDPRTSLALPFWQKVFKTLNLNDSYVIAIRNPLCCAHSINFGNFDFERGLVTWLACLLAACELTKNKKRIVVDYDELMGSPHKQLGRISNTLGLHHFKNETEWKIYCDSFLEKSLQHHRYTFEQCKSHPKVFPICIKFYSFLLKLARDELDFQKEDFQLEWNAFEEYIKQYFPLYVYMESLLTKHENYEKQLKKTQEQLKKTQDMCTNYEKSLSWRITRPLRVAKKIFQAPSASDVHPV